MKKTFHAKDLDIKITAKTSTLLSNYRYKYLTNDVAFTYQVDDNNLIGNYSGIKKYLKNIIKDTPDTNLIDDAKTLINYLESIKDDYDLFKIFTDAMGGDSLQGVTL